MVAVQPWRTRSYEPAIICIVIGELVRFDVDLSVLSLLLLLVLVLRGFGVGAFFGGCVFGCEEPLLDLSFFVSWGF